MRVSRYSTPHQITLIRTVSRVNYRKGLKTLLRVLDTHRGIYLSSGYEYPGRYSRWDFASTRPPLEIVSFDRQVEFRPLNLRGEMLNRILFRSWRSIRIGKLQQSETMRCVGRLKPLPRAVFRRGAQQAALGVFDSARADRGVPQRCRTPRLALVGAFGYDLLFQFDPID